MRSERTAARWRAFAAGLVATASAIGTAARPARADTPANAADPSPAPAAPGAPATPTAAPKVTPPVLTKDDGAVYPAQALADHVHDEVTVVLTLEVDASGHVTKATVDAAQGHGFDEAAVDAASKLTFEPARRNDKPIAVRIKHKYVFAPPLSRVRGRIAAMASGDPLAFTPVTLRGAVEFAPRTVTTDADGNFVVADVPFGHYVVAVAPTGFTPSTAELDLEPGEEAKVVLRLAGAAATATADAGAAGDDDQEVRVHGERPPREVTRRTLEQREIQRIPGTNGDALKSLQNLPGVARPPGFLGLLIVRGSAPQDTSVFVDGTLIPIVYHFGGLSSVVPTEILQKIDFYPGNFSAQYGRAMGGIVDVGVRDPTDKPGIHGLAQVDLIDARALVEAPLGKGWSFMVAGRRSYVDVWLKPVLEASGAGVTTAPVYYDYQAVLAKDFGKNASFRLMLFGSDDRLDLLIKSVNGSDPGSSGDIAATTGFWRLQARYKNRISDTTEVRALAAVGQDYLGFSFGDNFFNLTETPISGRAEVAEKLGRNVTLNTGLDMYYAPYDVHVRFPPPPKPGTPPAGPFSTQQALETVDKNAVYRPGVYAEVEATPWRGTRVVPGIRLDYAKDTQSFDVAPRISARQELTGLGARTALKGGVGVFAQPPQPQETNPVFGQAGLTSNRAVHYDIGVERDLSRQIDVSLEGFYKDLTNLVVAGSGNSGSGTAYGLELLLRYKPDARFFGWIAYTLSRSVLRDTDSSPERLSRYDQTHILTILGSYRLGRGWEIGGRFRLVSGSLTTPNTYGFVDENSGTNLPLQAYPPNGERLPTFHQLDIRVDKTWKFDHWQLGTYLDIQNVYNAGNVEGVSYNFDSTRRTYATGLPILPSLGMRAEF